MFWGEGDGFLRFEIWVQEWFENKNGKNYFRGPKNNTHFSLELPLPSIWETNLSSDEKLFSFEACFKRELMEIELFS